MNKKGILPQFIMRLLLALIIVFAISLSFSSCLNRYLRLSDQAKQSFNNIGDEIEKIALDPTVNKKLYPLVMDEETTIIGFSSDGDAFKVNVLEEGWFGGDKLKNYLIFPRPVDCNKNQACMCLCRKGLETTNNIPSEASCSNLICRNFKNFDFKKKIEFKDNKGNWENGFIILRTELEKERRKEIHITKTKEDGKTIISICEDQDCTTTPKISD